MRVEISMMGNVMQTVKPNQGYNEIRDKNGNEEKLEHPQRYVHFSRLDDSIKFH